MASPKASALAETRLPYERRGVGGSPSPDQIPFALDFDAGRPEISVVMPCLNEAETLAICIQKARRFFVLNDIVGEVVIADNGSTDGSQAIAANHGARIVHVATRGYGAALAAGIAAAHGRFVAIGDADDSYDFLGLMPFVEKLRDGEQLVMGNRFKGGIASGAMPLLHYYLGNPLLSFFGRLFYKAPIGDFHCGLRAFDREAIIDLRLVTSGMEYASEMVVKAQLARLRIAEVPTTLARDGRTRPSHLRSWRDGWRHLKFLLTFAPKWLAFYPGLAIFTVGLIGTILTLPGTIKMGPVYFGVHSLLVFAAGVSIGAQLMSFAAVARLFGVQSGLWPTSSNTEFARRWLSIDRGVVLGLVLVLIGLMMVGAAIGGWRAIGYDDIYGGQLLRLSIMAVMFLSLGVQAMVSGFIATLMASK